MGCPITDALFWWLSTSFVTVYGKNVSKGYRPFLKK
jgi:hypothetical protein